MNTSRDPPRSAIIERIVACRPAGSVATSAYLLPRDSVRSSRACRTTSRHERNTAECTGNRCVATRANATPDFARTSVVRAWRICRRATSKCAASEPRNYDGAATAVAAEHVHPRIRSLLDRRLVAGVPRVLREVSPDVNDNDSVSYAASEIRNRCESRPGDFPVA